MTFATKFLKGHPREGQRTDFIEKIWASLVDQQIALPEFWEGWYELNANYDFDGNNFSNTTIGPKHHTVRAGKRYKAGMKISPRFWSGKPYASKQIILAPDMEIKKVYDFEIKDEQILVNGRKLGSLQTVDLALNDGLHMRDFFDWFKWPTPFSGQILIWSDGITY